jgi:hypothetical protein
MYKRMSDLWGEWMQHPLVISYVPESRKKGGRRQMVVLGKKSAGQSIHLGSIADLASELEFPATECCNR